MTRPRTPLALLLLMLILIAQRAGAHGPQWLHRPDHKHHDDHRQHPLPEPLPTAGPLVTDAADTAAAGELSLQAMRSMEPS